MVNAKFLKASERFGRFRSFAVSFFNEHSPRVYDITTSSAQQKNILLVSFSYGDSHNQIEDTAFGNRKNCYCVINS